MPPPPPPEPAAIPAVAIAPAPASAKKRRRPPLAAAAVKLAAADKEAQETPPTAVELDRVLQLIRDKIRELPMGVPGSVLKSACDAAIRPKLLAVLRTLRDDGSVVWVGQKLQHNTNISLKLKIAPLTADQVIESHKLIVTLIRDNAPDRVSIRFEELLRLVDDVRIKPQLKLLLENLRNAQSIAYKGVVPQFSTVISLRSQIPLPVLPDVLQQEYGAGKQLLLELLKDEDVSFGAVFDEFKRRGLRTSVASLVESLRAENIVTFAGLDLLSTTMVGLPNRKSMTKRKRVEAEPLIEQAPLLPFEYYHQQQQQQQQQQQHQHQHQQQQFREHRSQE